MNFFQFFNTSSLTLGSNGAAAYQDGSTTKDGAFAENGVGYWANGDNQVFLAISVRY